MLKSGFMFKLLAGILISAIGFIFSDIFAAYILNRPDIGFFVRVASLSILFRSIFDTLLSAFVGLDRMENSALITVLQSSVKAALCPLLIFLGFSVKGALTGYILSYVVSGLLGLFILFTKSYHALDLSFNDNGGSFSSDLKAMIGYGFPLYISAILDVFLAQFQMVLLALFASDFEIGNFYVAMNLSALVTLFSNSISTALFPAFSKLNPKKKSTELATLFQRSVKYTSLVIVPVSMAVMILSKGLIYTIYGTGYSSAPLFLSLYVISFLSTGFGSLTLGNLFSGTGNAKASLKLGVLNAIIFIPLASLLTHFYNVIGFIIALLASSFLPLIYGLSLAMRLFNAKPKLEDSLRIYLASLLSVIPTLLFLRFSSFNSLINLVIGGSLFLLVYLTFIPLVGVLRAADLENLKLIFSKIKILWLFLKFVLKYEEGLLSAFGNLNSLTQR